MSQKQEISIGEYMDAPQLQIAVFYAKNSDVELLCELMSDEPFEVVSYDSIQSLIDHQSDCDVSAESTETPFAALVCADQTALETTGGLDPLAGELKRLTGCCERIIVLSASMDESSVCAYLLAGAHHVIPIGDSPTLMRARLKASLRKHSNKASTDKHSNKDLTDTENEVGLQNLTSRDSL